MSRATGITVVMVVIAAGEAALAVHRTRTPDGGPATPAPPPSAPGATAAPARSASPQPDGSVTAATLEEARLMAHLREIGPRDPAQSVALAREGNRRFPDSPDAPERASILIHALAAEGMPRDARAEAEYAVNHYPDSPWVRDIEGFTGAHRHRNAHVNDGGVLHH